MSYTAHIEKRYQALRIIGTVYKVLGVVVAVLTVLAVLGVCISSAAGGAAMSRFEPRWGGMRMAGGLVGGLVVGLLGLLYGLALSIGLYGLGEGIFLMLALEENTRATAMLLEHQGRTVTQPLSPSAPPPPGPKV